jgi:hypothetical protein
MERLDCGSPDAIAGERWSLARKFLIPLTLRVRAGVKRLRPQGLSEKRMGFINIGCIGFGIQCDNAVEIQMIPLGLIMADEGLLFIMSGTILLYLSLTCGRHTKKD